MSDPSDALADLLRDAHAHARWLADSGEHQVLKPASGAVKLARPGVARAPIAPAAPARPRVSTLEKIRAELGPCTRCKLCTGRQNIVFGVGSAQAELVFVGEGPGADEDRTGEPFVGAAGELLTKMILAMGLTRAQVYICNVVKCRPPGNRTPEPDEIAACQPFLTAQLAAIQPKVIVTLGGTATQLLLGETHGITKLRGQWRSYQGIKVMPTFHPSYLLRQASAKREVWDDLKTVMAELGLTRPT